MNAEIALSWVTVGEKLTAMSEGGLLWDLRHLGAEPKKIRFSVVFWPAGTNKKDGRTVYGETAGQAVDHAYALWQKQLEAANSGIGA